MAHFAQLDDNNKVTNVIVVNNNVLLDENGDEQESLGIDFCKSLCGADTNWKQTSYNTKGNQYWEYVDVDGQEFQDHVVASDQSKKFRGNYAGIGYTYDTENDVFIGEKPADNYTLNTSTWLWEEN